MGITVILHTAGVIGANIGAGMMLMFGAPIVGFLLAWALKHAGSEVAIGGRTLPAPAIVIGVTVVHFAIGIAMPWDHLCSSPPRSRSWPSAC